MSKLNKFHVLNMMQGNCKKDLTIPDCWELKVTCKMKSIIRTRVVTFIRKFNGKYEVVLTGQTFNSFMAALSSLFSEYVNALRKLVMAMVCPVGYQTKDFETIVENSVSEFLNPFQVVPVPTLPTYDRGKKKEKLHPLRRQVTKAFNGKYER